MSSTTTQPVAPFTDWHNYSRIDHQLTNAEILEQFGNHPDTPDANAATYIAWWKVPAKNERLDGSLRRTQQRFYCHLDLYNQGAYNLTTRNDPLVTYRQKRDLIESFAFQLELNPSQRSRVRPQYLWLDLQGQGVRMELVAIAVCAYAVHSDFKAAASIRKCHPQTPPDDVDPVFMQVLQAYYQAGDFTPSDFEKQYGKIQNLFANWPELPQKRVEDHRGPDAFDQFGIDERTLVWEESEKADASALAEVDSIGADVEGIQNLAEGGYINPSALPLLRNLGEKSPVGRTRSDGP